MRKQLMRDYVRGMALNPALLSLRDCFILLAMAILLKSAQHEAIYKLLHMKFLLLYSTPH